MTLKTEGNVEAGNVLADRRRPGRPAYVSPVLLPVLRKSELPHDLNELIEFEEPDQVSGATGLLAGVALSAPLWVGIVLIGRWILS